MKVWSPVTLQSIIITVCRKVTSHREVRVVKITPRELNHLKLICTTHNNRSPHRLNPPDPNLARRITHIMYNHLCFSLHEVDRCVVCGQVIAESGNCLCQTPTYIDPYDSDNPFYHRNGPRTRPSTGHLTPSDLGWSQESRTPSTVSHICR